MKQSNLQAQEDTPKARLKATRWPSMCVSTSTPSHSSMRARRGGFELAWTRRCRRCPLPACLRTVHNTRISEVLPLSPACMCSHCAQHYNSVPLHIYHQLQPFHCTHVFALRAGYHKFPPFFSTGHIRPSRGLELAWTLRCRRCLGMHVFALCTTTKKFPPLHLPLVASWPAWEGEEFNSLEP